MAFVLSKLQRILSFLCPRPIPFSLLLRRVADPCDSGREAGKQEVIRLLATPACMTSARKRSFCEQLKVSPQEQDGASYRKPDFPGHRRITSGLPVTHSLFVIFMDKLSWLIHRSPAVGEGLRLCVVGLFGIGRENGNLR